MRGEFKEDVRREYFEWLYDYMCAGKFSTDNSFRKLLEHLHELEFTYSIPRDRNRAEDGKNMHFRFIIAHEYEYEDISEEILDVLDAPCSVLEMLIALSIRCEETIMDDPDVGDRTAQWFWNMINNLGLGGMIDSRFDCDKVDRIISRLLSRSYAPDGTGGLFTIKNCKYDLRDVEIWVQLCWYLDTIT